MTNQIENPVYYRQAASLQFGPILITLTVIIAFWNWYFNTVDSQWLIDNMLHIQVMTDDLGTEEQKILSSILTIDFLKFSTLLGAIGSLVISLLILSAYVVLVSRFVLPQGQEVGFTTAINVSSVSSLMTASIHLLYGIYVWLAQESKVNLYEVDFLSLNNALLGLSPEHVLFGFANSISIATLLFIVCCGHLMSKKSSFTFQQATILYLVPYAAIWGFLLINAVI
ncbi:YIP1 family protein [Thalassotalea marina]|uniref:Yip1 domain-containing protein n=1 Tax=Thalassotalea marina TaxID=1673741 RepID=A0A919EIY0_9GAMM|nr:YIP1 family protein [Thalassotalea marina]GHF84314.1 hypothetical protein GCM10017161_09640 [Thalassotalea marina]